MMSGKAASYRARVTRAIECLREEAILELQQCVAIRSVCGNVEEEEKMQQHMCELLSGVCDEVRSEVLSAESIAAAPHTSPPIGGAFRPLRVVAGVVNGDEGGGDGVAGVSDGLVPKPRSLVFNGHVDVVPVESTESWTFDPWRGEVSDGRLYGRGSGDMKAGILAAVFALRALQDCGLRTRGRVHVHSVLDEECTGNGTAALLAGLDASDYDACIIPEPFPFLMQAQLGVMWCDVEVHGTPVHVLDAKGGCNAIEVAVNRIWPALKELEREWNEEKSQHSPYSNFPHPINFNLGAIEGGCWRSSVPEQCTLHARVGFFPRKTLKEVQEKVEHVVATAAQDAQVAATVLFEGFAADACECDESSPLFDVLSECHEHAYGRPAERGAVCCTTDARFYQLYRNIPTTCYGPEFTRNIHGIDESVSLESYLKVIEIFALFMIEWCGVTEQ